MSRMQPVVVERASGPARDLLDRVKARLGVTPNMMRTMANSPAVLAGYLEFSGALDKGALNARVREAIALAVGQANRCQYCVSAHTVLGGKAGLSAADLAAARAGDSSDTKTAAALKFALAVNTQRGRVGDADLTAARSAGLSEAEIAEIVAVVALNVFTNYFNHVADPEIDFPVVAI